VTISINATDTPSGVKSIKYPDGKTREVPSDTMITPSAWVL
jgi:hypothetical protein